MTIEQKCVEIFKTGGLNDGKLLGYAIFFSGSWDAWRLAPVGYKHMERIPCDGTKDGAILAVTGD